MPERLYKTKNTQRRRYRVTKEELLRAFRISGDPEDMVLYSSPMHNQNIDFSVRETAQRSFGEETTASFHCPSCGGYNEPSFLSEGEELYCTGCGACLRVFGFTAVVDTVEDES